MRSHSVLESLQADVLLAPHTTLGVGGTARHYIHVTAPEDLNAAFGWAAQHDVPVFTLGGGSNLVIADEGFRGLVVHMGVTGVRQRSDGGDVLFDVGAGEPWDPFVERTVNAGLAGTECLSGIPGTVGGTPIQNVGAYGQEVSETIDHVAAFDTTANALVQLRAPECGFSYRASRFKGADAGRFIVTGVTFRLRAGPPRVTYLDVVRYIERHGLTRPGVADVRAAVLEIRRSKGMVLDASDPDTRSVGSFFMNPVVSVEQHGAISRVAAAEAPSFPVSGAVKVPAAWLIERAGFTKGYAEGAVGLSTKHPLAIVNRGGALARDVVRFAAHIKRRVADRFGVLLRPEPVFVGFEGDELVAYLQKANG